MTQPWWSSPGPANNQVYTSSAGAYISPDSSVSTQKSPDQIEVAFRRIAESGGGSTLRWGEVMDKYRSERELSPTRSPYRGDESRQLYGQGSVTLRMDQTPPPPQQTAVPYSNGYPPPHPTPPPPPPPQQQQQHPSLHQQPPAIPISQPPHQPQYQQQQQQQQQQHPYPHPHPHTPYQSQQPAHYQQQDAGPPPPPPPSGPVPYATQEALEKAEQRAVNLEKQVQDLYRLLAEKDKAIESNSRPTSPQRTPERPSHSTRIPDDPATRDYPVSPVYRKPVHPNGKMSHQSLHQKYRESDHSNLIPPYRGSYYEQRGEPTEYRERGRETRERRDSNAGMRRTSSLRSRSSGQQQSRPVSRTRSSSLHKRPPVIPEYDHEEIARNRAQKVASRRNSLGKDKNFNFGKHLVSVGNIESHYSSRWADSLRNKGGPASRPQWNANLKRDVGWQKINDYDRQFTDKQNQPTRTHEEYDYDEDDFEEDY